MPDCRRLISPRGSVSNITRSSHRSRTGSAAFQLKLWARGPANWVLNRRRSLSIYYCTTSRNCTGCCSERKANERGCVRAQTGNRRSGANGNSIQSARHCSAALAPSTGREWETGITEKGDAQFYLLGPLPDQACELCVSRIGGRYILEDGSGRLLFEHRNLDIVALHARAAVPSTSWLMVTGDHAVVCDSEHLSRKARADDRGDRRAAGAARAAAGSVRLIASS